MSAGRTTRPWRRLRPFIQRPISAGFETVDDTAHNREVLVNTATSTTTTPGSEAVTVSDSVTRQVTVLPSPLVQALQLAGGGLAGADARQPRPLSPQPVPRPQAAGTLLRIDTPGEREYYLNGGILQYVLRSMAASA